MGTVVQRWEVLRRTSVNNNSENRVAFITVNDLLPPTHHPWLLLIPLPLHFRPVIYSSVSVICAFSQWESRRKEGPWDGGKNRARWAELEECRAVSVIAGPREEHLVWAQDWGWGEEEVKGYFAVFDCCIACCRHKQMAATTQAVWRGVAFINGLCAVWHDGVRARRGFPLCISLGGSREEEGGEKGVVYLNCRRPWQRMEVCLILL